MRESGLVACIGCNLREESMKELIKSINELKSEEKQELADTLRYVADLINELPTEKGEEVATLKSYVSELEGTNAALNARLENAKEYFKESKEAIEKAEDRVKAMISRNLQKTRDELYSLGTALHQYAADLSIKPSSKMTLVQVNNLLAGLDSIINNLEENDLWDQEKDLKPDLSQIEKQKKTTASRKARTKKCEQTEDTVQLSITDQVVE